MHAAVQGGGGGGAHGLEPLVAPLVCHLVCLNGCLRMTKLLAVQVFKYITLPATCAAQKYRRIQ